jgi:hypothetical protein
MTEFAWDTAVNDDQSPELELEPQEHEERQEQEEPEEPATLTLSTNDFSALEERVLRTVEIVRRERHARAVAEERATRAEAQLREQAPLVDQLEKEVSLLRAERDHVRERVERLLAQLDALEL